MPTVYRCRSALKLIEIQNNFNVFGRTRALTVVDLAAAPGGFSQVALEEMVTQHRQTCTSRSHQATHNHQNDLLLSPFVVAVDQRPIRPLHGSHAIIQANIQDNKTLHVEVQNALLAATPSAYLRSQKCIRPVDVVLHDGVSVASGQKFFSVTYAQNQMVLQMLKWTGDLFSEQAVHQGISSMVQSVSSVDVSYSSKRQTPYSVAFVSKVFRSRHFPAVLTAFQTFFSHVASFRPSATGTSSEEMYLVAIGFRTHRWVAYKKQQKRVQLGCCSGKRKEHSANLFSLPPFPEDLPRGREDFFWRCVGCQELRQGVVRCPQCGEFSARSRLK